MTWGVAMFYNYFGRHGTTCKDPPFTVALAGGSEYGLLDTSYGVQEIIEWLIMADHGVPFGEVRHHCQRNNPKLDVKDRRSGKTLHFTYNGGRQ